MDIRIISAVSGCSTTLTTRELAREAKLTARAQTDYRRFEGFDLHIFPDVVRLHVEYWDNDQCLQTTTCVI